MKIFENKTLETLGNSIGKGLLAGLAGTAAITLSQLIEMKITKRKPGNAPVKVVSETAGVKPVNAAQKEKAAQEIHWAYGTLWGIGRGLINYAGLKRVPAALVHFGAVWGTAMVMLPKFKAAPPVTEEDPRSIAIDGFHHAVYALVAGLVYDALDASTRRERYFNKMIGLLHL
ncbi:MAG: hypothetical protein JWR02_736 [Mucilaginibacter sp.]|nr:hypothetical protein [Mucilaginibacter sp.]